MTAESRETGSVIVTGASRGIGLAIAEHLALHGQHVWLVARQEQALADAAKHIRESGGSVDVAVCDVADPNSAKALVDRVVSVSGRLHGLVNNAGVNRRGSLTEVSPEDYDYIMNINVKGLLFLSQAVAHVMARGGAIVNVASLNAINVLRGVGLYAMSKAAVVQFTRAFAIDVADRGIRVNAVAPGFIRTDFNAALWERPEMKAWVEGNTPLGRLGQPKDVASAVQFLLGQESGFITGEVLTIDGGFLPSRLWPL